MRTMEFHSPKQSRKRFRPTLKKERALPSILNQKEELYKCHVCGIIADDEECLFEHHSLHEGKPALQCITCNQMLKSKGSLVRHTRIHVSECAEDSYTL